MGTSSTLLPFSTIAAAALETVSTIFSASATTAAATGATTASMATGSLKDNFSGLAGDSVSTVVFSGDATGAGAAATSSVVCKLKLE
jgi:hypothetical protein